MTFRICESHVLGPLVTPDCHDGSQGADKIESITAIPETEKDTAEGIHFCLTEIPIYSFHALFPLPDRFLSVCQH